MSAQMNVKKTLKALVRSMEYLLPERLFNKTYNVAFPMYKKTIQVLYLVKGIVLYSYREPVKWVMVKKIYSVMPFTLVGIGGLEATYEAVFKLNQKGVEGDIVELGVARGGCAALMGRAAFDKDVQNKGNRTLWLFDSYEGLPEPTDNDFDASRGHGTGDHVRPLPKGSCLGTLDDVKKLMFGMFSFPENKVKFVKGWFQDTVPTEGKKIEKIAILRIDGDWYESTKCCLEGLYDKVATGGIVIIDDYQSCYGCQKAVDEFLSDNNINVQLKLDGRGGCYFNK